MKRKKYDNFRNSIIEEIRKQDKDEVQIENSVMLRFLVGEVQSNSKDIKILQRFRTQVITTTVVILSVFSFLAAVLSIAKHTPPVIAEPHIKQRQTVYPINNSKE